MRIWGASVGALAVVLSLLVVQSPVRAADALTGKMAMFNYLLGGAWTCSTKVPAMNGRRSHLDASTIQFDVAPMNVLHDHVSASDYAGDDYFAFDPKSNMYWNGSLGSTGNHGYASSTNGNVYSGLSWSGKNPENVTTRYTKVNANLVKTHVTTVNGGREDTIDSVCSR